MLRLILITLLLALALPSSSSAQCPAKPPLFYYGAPPHTTCLCFIPNEEVGVIFTPPAADYPLEVLAVNILWKSQLGGAPISFENGIHLYNGGLPNPGPRIATILLPALSDGVMNNFPFPSAVPVNAGPITATLEIINQSSGGSPFTPSVAYDSGACQAGINVVKVNPGGWLDACTQGVPGNWVFELVYRPCQTPVPTERVTWGEIKRLHSSTAETEQAAQPE